MTPLSWKTTKEDAELLKAITERAAPMMPHSARQTLWMDVTACHANGCPLDLEGLLHADDYDFMHDVVGIVTHIDRQTGELRDCFLPRYAVPESATA